MIIWKKKLIECCKCHKKYSFDDNLFYHFKEYILVCPNCNLMHKVDIQLLGKEYEGLKKVDRLDLTVITMGNDPINQTSTSLGWTTQIDGNVPANASGTITSIEVWAGNAWIGVQVATFYRPDPDNFPNKFTTRDYETLPNNASAGYQQYDVDIDVVEGDFLGIYLPRYYYIDYTTGAAGWSFTSSPYDQIPCTDITFGINPSRKMSLRGTGETPPIGWPHKWNGVTIGKLNGAVLSKWNGIA